MQKPHNKRESGSLMGVRETTDCVPDLLSSPADGKLAAVKGEPLPEFANEDVKETVTIIVKEEYEIEDLSDHPPTDNQMMVKDDAKPFTSTCREKPDLYAVKEVNFEPMLEVTHWTEETKSEFMEQEQTQMKSFESFPEVKVEIVVVSQLSPCSKGENNVENVAVSRRHLDHSVDTSCKIFKTQRKLEDHIQTHTRERCYLCTICSRTFTTKGNLNSHSLSHSGERPHRCTECDSAFIRKSHLKAHQLSHSGEKPFRCNDCGSTFSRKSYLKTHLYSHSGLRPFSCSICNCTFSRKFNLKQHQLSHSRERSFACKMCHKIHRHSHKQQISANSGKIKLS